MLLTQLDMMLAPQALHMLASQTRDLSHIEFEQSENISNLPQGKYIEPSNARHIDKKSARFDLTNVAVQFVKTPLSYLLFAVFMVQYN